MKRIRAGAGCLTHKIKIHIFDIHTAVLEGIARLSEIQQRRMLMLAAGMSMHEIADKEGVDYRAVYDSIKAARKKFLKYF